MFHANLGDINTDVSTVAVDIYRAVGKGGGGDTRASRLVAMLNRLLYIYFISSENINTLLVKCIEPYLCITAHDLKKCTTYHYKRACI